MEPFGSHCIVELYDCSPALLDDKSFVVESVRGAVKQGMATLLGEVSHHFHPQGVTALALIAESHVAVHTWPEYGYAAVDVFTCGDRASAEKACEYLIQVFEAERYNTRKLDRGMEVKAPTTANSPPPAVPAMSASAGR